MKMIEKMKSMIFVVAAVLLLFALTACESCDEHELVLEKTELQATCEAEGREVYICTNCGTRVEESIPKTNEHDFGEWSVSTNAGFDSDGEKQRSCKDCGETESEIIPALGKYPDVLVSDKLVEIDLSGYQIVYPNLSVRYPSVIEVKNLAEAIKGRTGLELVCDKQASLTETDKEILIGETNRAESKAALEAIEGDGFGVHVIGSKIVIIGSNDVETATAVQYFIRKYISDELSNTTLSVSESTIAYNAPVFTIMTDSAPEMELVYDKDLDDDKKHAYTVAEGDHCRDYPVQVADFLASDFAQLSKLDVAAFTVRRNDTETEKELIIGPTTDNELENTFRATLAADEYGILVTENKIVLTAHSDYALQEGYRRLKSLVTVARRIDASGDKIWSLPVGYCVAETANENWMTDFPTPEAEGIEFVSSVSLGHNTLQCAYKGEGVTAEAYEAYKAELLAAGFDVYYENEIEGSKFVTLTNDEMMLYVAYNAFAHGDEEHNYVDATHVTKYPYLDNDPLLRVVSSPIEEAYLPDSTLFAPKDYEKVTETKITQVMLTNLDVGLAYIITLEDGSFVVIDGGWNRADGPTRVWNALNACYKEVWGTEPTPEKPIRISAWYATHGHNDHTDGFVTMYREHKASGLMVVERMIANFPDKTSLFNGAYDVIWPDENLEVLTEELGMPYNKVFAGQVLHIANLELEVLMTFSDHHPRRIDNANDSETVIMMKIHHKDAPDVVNKFLSLGDSMVYTSRFLCAMYGEYLECDALTLAHHGNIGSEIAIYKIAAPTAIFYPHHNGGYNQYIDETKKNEWPYSVSNYVVRELESLRYMYVAGVIGAENSETITLPCAADGTFNYEGIYNVVTGLDVPYEEGSLKATTTPAIKIPAK